jgi:hypothetical protein
LKLLSPAERLAEPRGPKVLIAGVNGVGKTSLLRTVSREALARTLLVDAEAGDLAIQDREVASVRPRLWSACRDLACAIGGPNQALSPSAPYSEAHYQAVIADPVMASLPQYEILFVDSLTEISRQCRVWAEQQPESFTDRGKKDLRGTYGLVARELIAWLRQIQHVREKTVILVAILERVEDDFGQKEWRLQLEGRRTARELPGIIDEVITMHWCSFSDSDKPVRAFVCTNPNPWQVPAKDRSGRLDQLEPPDLGKLLAKLALSPPEPAQGGPET